MPTTRIALAKALDNTGFARLGDMLRRSFDVEAMSHDAASVTVSVSDHTSSENLDLVLRRLLQVRRYASEDCIFSRHVGGSNDDPQPALERKGEVVSIGPGLFAFRGDFLRVRTVLDSVIRSTAGRHGAAELAYPALWPVQMLQSIDYFHDFPQLVILAAGVAPGYDARTVFAERFRKESSTKAIACTAENGLAPASNVLAPTVCDCCYWLLRGQRTVTDQTWTIHGQVFRNEASPDRRLDRLTAYTMREIVMVGREAFVMERRETFIDETIKLITALDLACDIVVADDPFFCNDALKKNAFQNIAHLKYEVRIPLCGEASTAVASINLHNDFFSRNYDFEAADGSRPISACIGFGYERFTYALFCRHGPELARWPRQVTDFLGLD